MVGKANIIVEMGKSRWTNDLPLVKPNQEGVAVVLGRMNKSVYNKFAWTAHSSLRGLTSQLGRPRK